nr:hypothetical protein [Tanacetum cinerariifolium]
MATTTTHLTHSHLLLHHHPLYNNFTTFLTTLTQPPHLRQLPRSIAVTASSSSTKTSVARRKPVKTNEDLCNDLKDFMNQVGMPDGCVPSLKELADHGRQDLANIVRRRGYKVIKEHLAASQEIRVTDSDVDGSLTEDKACKEELTGLDDYGEESAEDVLLSPEDTITEETSITKNFDDDTTEDKACKELTGLDDNEEESAEDVLLSPEDTITEETSITKDFDDDTSDDVESSFVADGLTQLSLQEKVVKFIQSGEIETFEDDHLDVVNAKKNIGSQNSTEVELTSANEEPSSQLLAVPDSANGSILTSPLANSTSLSRNITYNDQLASAESANTDTDKEIEARTKEDQAEINRIKVMLHHKELELSQLKEQIEKNKQALSELQDKAETEITKAQKLLMDKDAELQAAEESLLGLKQVQIEYWGDGETVEVAGSFNGWHHGVKLDPQPSSNITDPVELRFPTLFISGKPCL